MHDLPHSDVTLLDRGGSRTVWNCRLGVVQRVSLMERTIPLQIRLVEVPPLKEQRGCKPDCRASRENKRSAERGSSRNKLTLEVSTSRPAWRVRRTRGFGRALLPGFAPDSYHQRHGANRGRSRCFQLPSSRASEARPGTFPGHWLGKVPRARQPEAKASSRQAQNNRTTPRTAARTLTMRRLQCFSRLTL